MSKQPVAAGILTWPADEPQLIGSTCGSCGATTFPAQEHCPRCGLPDMGGVRLPRRGRLVSWTTQEFLPKEPYAGGESEDTFTPFGVGLVQLGDQVRVEARLTTGDPDELRFDMEVELVVVPFRVDDDGTEIVTFAFAPAES